MMPELFSKVEYVCALAPRDPEPWPARVWDYTVNYIDHIALFMRERHDHLPTPRQMAYISEKIKLITGAKVSVSLYGGSLKIVLQKVMGS